MKTPQRLSLARLPTPIHKLERFSARLGKDIYVWRDDLTGFLESGNKVRKLEYLLPEALHQKTTRVITAGGVQSNHTRATAWLARRLGLDVTLVVREPKQGPIPTPTGNLLLNRLCGAELKFISYDDYQKAGSLYLPFLEQVAKASQQKGETPYVIPEGGSVPLGCWGYLSAVSEMQKSWKASGPGSSLPDSLFLAVGSGGTHAGLCLGYALNRLPTETVWAVNVCDSAEYFQQRVGKLIEDTITQFDLGTQKPVLNILDGHFGDGYGLASDEDLRFYCDLAREDGVLLDPVYSGKAFRGMVAEINKAPDRFGRRILFLHSGGLLATFAYQEQYLRVLD